jgi:hypothetical protein
MKKLGLTQTAVLCAIALALGAAAHAEDYYVSIARGKGRAASKEAPAKDLGNIVAQLKPGDTVHIAEGTYLGRGESGFDKILVPVSIIGGYSDDFSSRDPWGAHKTILTGVNNSKNYEAEPPLHIDLSKYINHESGGTEMPKIVVDGLIIDQGPQNRYKDAEKALLVRKANPPPARIPRPTVAR